MAVGVFGKHPAWPDHMEDLEPGSRDLVDFRRWLYTEGIVPNVDSGRWEQLDPDDRRERSAHLVFASRADHEILALILPSSDAKGRDRYPLVLALAARGIPTRRLLLELAPLLFHAAPDLQRAASPQSAGAILSALRSRFAVLPGTVAAPAADELDRGSLARLAARPEFGPHAAAVEPEGMGEVGGGDNIGMIRLLYQLPTQAAPSAPGAARHLRAPHCADEPLSPLSAARAAAEWVSAFRFALAERAGTAAAMPLTLVLPAAPVREGWLDAIFGFPTDREWFCLFAGARAVPPVTAVPYSIPDAAAAAARETIRRSAQAAPVASRLGAARSTAILALAALCIAAATPRVFAQTDPSPPSAPTAQASNETDADRVAPYSQSINNAWLRWRVELSRRLEREPERLAEELRVLSGRLHRLDAEFVPRPAFALTDANPSSPEAGLQRIAERERERQLSLLMQRWRADVPTAPNAAYAADATAVADSFGTWLRRAEELRAEAAAALTAINNAHGLAWPDAHPTIDLAELADRWAGAARTRPRAGDGTPEESVRAAYSELDGRLQSLRRIARESDPTRLVESVRAAEPNRPELALAAWRRLISSGRRWPGDADDLRTELDLGRALRASIASVKDVSRRQSLLADIAHERSERFSRYLASANTDEDFAEALKLMDAFGVTRESLDGRLKYNLLLRDLKRDLLPRPDAQPLTDAAAEARIRAFFQQVEALPGGVSFLREAVALNERLTQVMKDPAPAQNVPSPDFSFGPAAAGFEGFAEGDALNFYVPGSSISEHREPVLRFRRVSVPPTARASSPAALYVSETEVSVGDVQTILAASGRGAELGRVIPPFNDITDPRRGPRSWQWEWLDAENGGKRARLVPAPTWLAVTESARFDGKFYPPGERPPPPSLDSPMNQVSPHAAMLIAAMAGCRLPTSDEWRAAAQVFAGPPSDRDNLRDQSWTRFADHIASLAAAGRSVPPANTGSYMSGRTRPASQGGPADQPAQEVWPWNDGFLWLAPAQYTPAGEGKLGVQRTRAPHFFGNVAEYTFDGSPPAAPTAEAVIQSLGQGKDIRVLGSSALAPAWLEPTTPIEVDMLDAVEGYADVGFRLVFTAPVEQASGQTRRLDARLVEILTPTPYIKARWRAELP